MRWSQPTKIDPHLCLSSKSGCIFEMWNLQGHSNGNWHSTILSYATNWHGQNHMFSTYKQRKFPACKCDMHSSTNKNVQTGWTSDQPEFTCVFFFFFFGGGGWVFFSILLKTKQSVDNIYMCFVVLRWSVASNFHLELFGNVHCVPSVHAAKSHNEGVAKCSGL